MIKDGDMKNNGKIEQDEFLTMMRRRRPSLESMDSGIESFRDEGKAGTDSPDSPLSM